MASRYAAIAPPKSPLSFRAAPRVLRILASSGSSRAASRYAATAPSRSPWPYRRSPSPWRAGGNSWSRVGGHRGLEPPHPVAHQLGPAERVRDAEGHQQDQVPGPGREGGLQYDPPPVRRDRAELAQHGGEVGRLRQRLRPAHQLRLPPP